MQQTGKQVQAGRHYGIDLLRLVAMFMICILHVNNFCSYTALRIGDFPWAWINFAGSQSLSIIAVNLYAMITGYVCITSQWNIKRYLSLWLQMFFYLVTLYAVGGILSGNGISAISLRFLLVSPFISPYWYFNAYTGVFLLIPFLNAFLSKLPRYPFIKLLIILLLILPCLNFVYAHFFHIGMAHYSYGLGYNVTWLSVLYIAGAYLRLHPITLSKRTCLMTYLIGAGTVFLLYTACCLRTPDSQGTPEYYMGYTFPINIIISVALFLFFSKVDIRRPFQQRIIQWAAPLSFGIYLIQCHPFMWNALHKLGNVVVAQYGHPAYAPLAGGLCLFLGCLCIDWLRYRLFRLCRANILAERMAALLTALWHKILPFLMPPRA